MKGICFIAIPFIIILKKMTQETKDTINEVLQKEIHEIEPIIIQLEHQMSLPENLRIMPLPDEAPESLAGMKISLKKLKTAHIQFNDLW
jgi:hypothetical protein